MTVHRIIIFFFLGELSLRIFKDSNTLWGKHSSYSPEHQNAITNQRINKDSLLLIFLFFFFLKKMFSLLGIKWPKVWPDMTISLNKAPDLLSESYNYLDFGCVLRKELDKSTFNLSPSTRNFALSSE